MKHLVLVAVTAATLAMASLSFAGSATANPVPRAIDTAAGKRLASLISSAPADVPVVNRAPRRFTRSGITIIHPVRVAIRPGDLKRTRIAKSIVRASRSRARLAAGRGTGATIASWYDDRPAACWDRRGRHAFPRGLRVWTAHKTLPCGTAIIVSGSSGTTVVRVWDRGPYVAGRGLDLSAAAFRAVCGSTGRGVCRVVWRVAS